MANLTAMDLMNQGIDPRTYQQQRKNAGVVENSKDCVHSPEKLLALEKLARNPKEIERKIKLGHHVGQVLLDHYYRTIGKVKFAQKEEAKAQLEKELTDEPLNVGAYTREELGGFRQEELIMLCRTYSGYGIDMRHCVMTTPPHHMVNWILRAQQVAGVTLPNVDLAPDPQSSVINTAHDQVKEMRGNVPMISHLDDPDLMEQQAAKQAQLATPDGISQAISEAVGTGKPPEHLINKFGSEEGDKPAPNYINGPVSGLVDGDGHSISSAPEEPTSAFESPPAIPTDPDGSDERETPVD